MSNPYNLTDEQLQAYSAQIAEERAARAQMPKGEGMREFREYLKWDLLDGHAHKMGLPPLQRTKAQQPEEA